MTSSDPARNAAASPAQNSSSSNVDAFGNPVGRFKARPPPPQIPRDSIYSGGVAGQVSDSINNPGASTPKSRVFQAVSMINSSNSRRIRARDSSERYIPKAVIPERPMSYRQVEPKASPPSIRPPSQRDKMADTMKNIGDIMRTRANATSSRSSGTYTFPWMQSSSSSSGPDPPEVLAWHWRRCREPPAPSEC